MKNIITHKIVTLALLGCAFASIFSSCGREISSNVYASGAVGEVSTTEPGVIINLRHVSVQDSEHLQDNAMGIIGGGVAGAYLGNMIGKGRGNTLATAAGGLAGATAGAFAEKALKTQDGIEYIVSLENGLTKTVVQGPQPAFTVGQRVWVIESQQGRSRIIPR